MNRAVYLGWSVAGALIALSWWAARRSESHLARFLLADRGPSAERAPGAFLRFGLLMATLAAVLLYSMVSVKAGGTQTILLVLMPFVLFPAAMGLVGGLYLLLRRRISRRPQ